MVPTTSTCGISRLTEPIDAARFLAEYAKKGKPVILSQRAAKGSTETIKEAETAKESTWFEKENLLRLWGEKEIVYHTDIEVDGKLYHSDKEHNEHNGTLSEYVRRHMGHCRVQPQPYVFYSAGQLPRPDARFLNTDEFTPHAADARLIDALIKAKFYTEPPSYANTDLLYERYLFLGSRGSGGGHGFIMSTPILSAPRCHF